jgi:hypothetical protein
MQGAEHRIQQAMSDGNAMDDGCRVARVHHRAFRRDGPHRPVAAGIGSEGYVAVGMGRRFIGAELKASYFKQAVGNLEAAAVKTQDLFAA